MAPIFFPQPYPDEIMYSVIARYHQKSGNYYNIDSMRDLFNIKAIIPSITLQTRLGVLSDNVKHLGIRFEDLLIENTMFPYLMVFTQPETYERVYQWSKCSDNHSDRLAIGLLLRNIFQEQMMYCPECFKEELLQYGEGYWHRIHQTPGIFVCKKHQCRLLPSIIPTFNHKPSNYKTLCTEVMQVAQPLQLQEYCDFSHDYDIYEDTKYLYDNFVSIRKLYSDLNYSFREAFLPALIGKQFAAPKGSLKTKAFEDAFIGFYGNNYLKTVGLSVSNSISNKWIYNFFRGNSKHHTYALEYILMARFLFGSFENFINETKSKERLNIVVSSNNKIVLADPTSLELHRNEWIKAIRKDPDRGRDIIRKNNRSTYTWLNNHDKEWLREHLPNELPKGGWINNTVNWPERDKTLANQINSKAIELKTAAGKPCKVTKKAIYRALDCEPVLINYPDKLPLAKKAINDSVETVKQFRKRLCYYIIETLEEQGIPPTTMKVLTMMNIKKDWSELKEIIREIFIEKGI